MRNCLLLLLLLMPVPAQAALPWQHYRLDVSLKIPDGWKIIQGPVMLHLDPKQRMQGERRPKFGLTWQQAPPTLDEFQSQVSASIAKSGGTLLAAQKLKISGYPAIRLRARMPEKVFQFTTELILIRVDAYAGYLITTESMQVDTAAADPIFVQILASLKVGPRPRAKSLKVQN